jgi:hypothetical protein
MRDSKNPNGHNLHFTRSEWDFLVKSVKPSSLVWRKSRLCDSNACVEAAMVGEEIAVRDSKDPNGPILRFTVSEWNAFVKGVRAGDFHFNPA